MTSRGAGIASERMNRRDACFDEVPGNAILGIGLRLPDGARQGPEIALVVAQDLSFNQVAEHLVDDPFRTGSEPLDPVLRAVLLRVAGDLRKEGVQRGNAGWSVVDDEQ